MLRIHYGVDRMRVGALVCLSVVDTWSDRFEACFGIIIAIQDKQPQRAVVRWDDGQINNYSAAEMLTIGIEVIA